MTDWSPPSTPKGQISRVPHLPGLDGLRAVAVVSVMVYHANRAWLHGGFLGVEVFFVISGYLITLLLIAEHERSGHVDLKQFWLRRFRRLLPALFVMLALLVVYLAVGFRKAQGRTRGDILGGVGYVSNWYQIWVGAGYTATEAFAPLRHLWSLAVEEQFYLLWPLIMVAILSRGRSHLPRVALWLMGISVGIAVAMAVLYVPGDINSVCTPEDMHGYWSIGGRCVSVNDALYLSTITRAGGLMMGAAFAMVWRPVALMRGPMRNKSRQLDVLALLGVAGLGALFWKLHLADPALTMLTGSRFDPWLFRGGFLLTGAATLMIIAAVTHQRSMAGVLLGNPVLNWIGTRSYGLYLYHWPIYQIIRKQAGLPLSINQFVGAIIITIPLTEASYRFIEMPVRRGAIGNWLRRERRRPSPAVLARRRQMAIAGLLFTGLLGWAGVSIAMAPNRCVGVIECSLLDPGGDADAADPGGLPDIGDTTTTTTTTTVAGDPGIVPVATELTTTTVTTVAPTTTVPVADRPPIAIGESVMLGAKPQLEAGGFEVFAQESKQAGWIIDVVGQLRAAGRIGSTIVIQSGTNGPVTAEQYDAMMAVLPAAEVTQVVFLTVKAPKPWIDGNNALIWALPGKYPNVTILDWQGNSAQIQGELSVALDGGVHLRTTKAKQFYANYIFDITGHRDREVPLE